MNYECDIFAIDSFWMLQLEFQTLAIIRGIQHLLYGCQLISFSTAIYTHSTWTIEWNFTVDCFTHILINHPITKKRRQLKKFAWTDRPSCGQVLFTNRIKQLSICRCRSIPSTSHSQSLCSVLGWSRRALHQDNERLSHYEWILLEHHNDKFIAF